LLSSSVYSTHNVPFLPIVYHRPHLLTYLPPRVRKQQHKNGAQHTLISLYTKIRECSSHTDSSLTKKSTRHDLRRINAPQTEPHYLHPQCMIPLSLPFHSIPFHPSLLSFHPSTMLLIPMSIPSLATTTTHLRKMKSPLPLLKRRRKFLAQNLHRAIIRHLEVIHARHDRRQVVVRRVRRFAGFANDGEHRREVLEACR
jgi:hypothetical protein